jgi:uroporphyrin-III C-methyltransferase/precorrin-2 dehydrogenase/sirohydrochlorin ferrochelatase
MKAFPLFITVEGKKIVVFGGGADAAAKLRLVLKTKAEILVVAEQLDKWEIELGHARWVNSPPLDYALPVDTAFVFAATGNHQLDARLAAKAQAAGILVCAADQPAVSDFFTPAIVDRDPVVVAIGTEGTAPVLSRQIKASVEALLEPTLGSIAVAANRLRPWAATAIRQGAPRRSFWKSFFEQAINTVTDQNQDLDALAQKLADQPATNKTALVSLVGAGPGNPELLTLKARKALDVADVVIYPPELSLEILELARREAIMITASGKAALDHSIAYANDGNHVVRLLGSDPQEFSELGLIVNALTAACVSSEIIPGVTQAIITHLQPSLSPSSHEKAA